MAESTFDPSTILSLAMSVVVELSFMYHLWRSYGSWQHHRDGRALRGFVVTLMVVLGTTVLLMTSLHRIGAIPLELAVGVSYILRGALLVGGLFVVVSWWRDVPPRDSGRPGS